MPILRGDAEISSSLRITSKYFLVGCLVGQWMVGFGLSGWVGIRDSLLGGHDISVVSMVLTLGWGVRGLLVCLTSNTYPTGKPTTHRSLTH